MPGHALAPKNVFHEVKKADEIGIGSLWIAERPNTKDIGVMSGIAAGLTQRMGIASGLVTNLTLRHPLTVAGYTSTMMTVTDNRFSLGIGRGVNPLSDAVCPGMMLTDMTANNKADPAENEAYNAGLRQFIPVGRAAQPEEVAEAALFLASDDSSYMLGGEIIVDSGVSMVR